MSNFAKEAILSVVSLSAFSKETATATKEAKGEMTKAILTYVSGTTWDTTLIDLSCRALQEKLTAAGFKRIAPTVSDFRTLCRHAAMIDVAAKSWSREAGRIRQSVMSADEKQTALAVRIKEAKEALQEQIDIIASLEREYAILTGSARPAFDELVDMVESEQSGDTEQLLQRAA